MYSSPYSPAYYANGFNQQTLSERIDSQIAQLNQMKEQLKANNQPAINQTFQLAPTHNGIRYASTIDDVQKEMVIGDTPFFSKDMSVLWIKYAKGDIKAYELSEIIPKDDKDILIEGLQFQIEQLKEEIKGNAKPVNINADESIESEKPADISTISKPTKKSK